MHFPSLGRKPRARAIETVLDRHGDLIFDLCESVLRSPHDGLLAFRAILKEIGRHPAAGSYDIQERAFALRLTCDRLRILACRQNRGLLPTEQLELDSAPQVQSRLKRFDGYFQKLPVDDQLILLLKDKHGIPLSEIATALSMPEGSLKVRRQQALRALEDWIWGGML